MTKKIPNELLYETIKKQPGIRKKDLIKKTGIHRGSLDSRLATLESRGFLIIEDDHGRFYPYV